MAPTKHAGRPIPRCRLDLARAWGLERALTPGQLAAVMRLSPTSGDSTILRWEGRGGITDAARTALAMMLAGAGGAHLIAWNGPPMTGADLEQARIRLGQLWHLDGALSVRDLSYALGFPPDAGPGLIHECEIGAREVGGPMSLAVDLMLEGALPPVMSPAAAEAERYLRGARFARRLAEFPGAERPALPLTGRGGKTPATVT